MGTNQNQTGRFLFLAAFALMLLWPLFTLIGVTPGRIDTFEKRNLAAFPKEINSVDDWVRWPRLAEKYLEDRLPNRGLLLRLNAWIKYYVFGTSPADSVLIGQNGWLFHRMPDDLLEIKGRLQRKPYQIRRLRMVLEERRDWLAERGIDYLVIIAPTKQTIYPEKLPWWLKPSGSGSIRREMLKAELQRAGSGLKLFDSTPALRKAKKKWGDALFYRQNSHWTYRGALEAYKALARQYPEWFCEPGQDWIEVESPRDSNLMQLMGLPGQETTVYPQPPEGLLIPDSEPDTELLKARAGRGGFEFYQHPDSTGPRLCMMGDSFATWITGYIVKNFSRTVFSNSWGLQWQFHEQFPTEIIAAEHPALVIDQMLENRLDLGPMRNLLGHPTGNNHPPEVRTARLRRLLRNSVETTANYRYHDYGLQIRLPKGGIAPAYIVRITLQASVKTLIQSVSPYAGEAAQKDPCVRGGELTRLEANLGRSQVLVCATPHPDTGLLRIWRVSEGGTSQILNVSIAPHPDV